MNHNKTLITETSIENCYISDDKFYYIVPWWNSKKHEFCDTCNIPEWIVQDIANNITSFIVDIKVIVDQIVITKFYKVIDI
jgi:hypothetical protein